MFKWMKCKHPIAHVHVQKEATVTPHSIAPEFKYETVVLNLYCTRCGESTPITYARLVATFD